MQKTQRPILRITKKHLIEPEKDRPLELGVYDVLLPCRLFDISHKVAEVGRVSLTAEFLLRLLKSVDGMKEMDVAAFFGYDKREMSFVLSEVETNDFVFRKDGRLFLTTVGQSLFRNDSEHPEIFEVENRRETVGFDLIALAPEERRYLDIFQRRLPELRASDAAKLSSATRLVPSAFRRFYGEIASRRDPTATLKRSLYSIDVVGAMERFSNLVRISVQSMGLRPSVAEPEMSDWRPEHECEDRREIVEAASRFVDELKVQSRPDDLDAYQVLLDLAPNYLKDFARQDGLAVERFYREAYSRAGDVRADRPTVPLLGSLFSKESTRRLFDVAEYGVRAVPVRPALCIWFAPQNPHWGATTALPLILDQIKSRALGGTDEDEDKEDGVCKTIGLIADHAPKYIMSAFDVVGISSDTKILPSLEILFVPNVLVAATVNAPIGIKTGIPVPLGFASFDPQVITRTQNFILSHLDGYRLSNELLEKIHSAVSLGSTSPSQK